MCWASCATAIKARGDLDSMHQVAQDQLVPVVLYLSVNKIGVLECKIQSYRLSRQGGLQLFAELGISWDQLFPEPRNAGSGW